MSNEPLILQFRRGERIRKDQAQYCSFDAVDEVAAKKCGYVHDWRIIVCSDPDDIAECRNCGKQVEKTCHFDDEFS